MKKIAFITTISFTMEKFVLDFAKYIASEDYEITLICNYDKEFVEKLPEHIKFIPIKIKRGVDFNLLYNIYQFYKILKKHQFDLIQYCTTNASFYGSIAGRFSKIKQRLYCQWGIYYVGSHGFKRKIFKFIEKMICLNSTVIQPDSNSNLEFSIQEKLYKREKAYVILKGSSRGVNLKKFDATLKDTYYIDMRNKLHLMEYFIFGYVGRLNLDKGLKELFLAFKRIEQENMRLVVVGPNDNLQQLDDDLLVWVKNNPNILFLPETQNPQEYFAMFDVNVLPSYREGMPSALLEALAMKSLTIATNINGIKDVITDGYNGFLVESKDEVSLAKKMKEVYEQYQQLSVIKEQGHQFIKEYFDQEKIFVELKKDRIDLLNK